MERRAIAIRGTVQGVGFRPFVHGIASRLALNGFVKNQGGGVEIAVEGEEGLLDQFLRELTGHAPPLAHIDELSWQSESPRGDSRFRIESSDGSTGGGGAVVISPDVATCADCLAELFDPRDRRYGYPFINCMNCGPRLTIVTGSPYDRERTTMARFAMCAACRAEYDDPTDRRFHAQPIACAVCGPKLTGIDSQGNAVESDDLIGWFADQMRVGKIGAIKGLGGYHLACDGRNTAAVTALRDRKHRDEKPFAVMVRDVATGCEWCELQPAEKDLLTSSRRPIVLLRKRQGISLAEPVAPGNPYLGVMLPYTPLHHLLFQRWGNAPLVMTSGNRADEPIAYEEPEALDRLRGIADVFLIHDRPIHVRCDDSVTRMMGESESPIRRSRGYAPQPIRLPFACPVPILAVGGQQKVTFALGRDHHAILSHHIGDLNHFEAYRAFEKDVELYERTFAVRPEYIAHDLHPDYASTRYAIRRESSEGIRRIPVQHHHAHMAGCMAEHGLDLPAIGVTFDGTGYGTDGTIWGGEFLVGDYRGFRRAAHLRPVRMPGGEKAIREPWRMAAAYLIDAGVDCGKFDRRIPTLERRMLRVMLDKGINSPMTSSAGRLFDAVGSIIGLRDTASYEGQAAVELEWLADGVKVQRDYPFEITQPPSADSATSSLIVDTRPLIRAIVDDVNADETPARMARRFHSTVSQIIFEICMEIRNTTGLKTVLLTGGVFMNALLSITAGDRLKAEGFEVYRHHLVPPNDGGLSLGQIAIAASLLAIASVRG